MTVSELDQGIARSTTSGETSSRMQCMEVWGGNGVADTAVSTTGLDVWLYSQPYGGGGEGGDVYYVSSCSSGRITRVALADVRGHGDEVRTIATSLRRAMRRHINHVNQAKLVRAVNREFVGVGDAGTFATGLITTFFVPTGRLTLSNAGHPTPLVYQAADDEWHQPAHAPADAGAGAWDVPLGIFESARYGQVSLELTTQDVVVCYTDGLTECVDEQGEMLGIEGVRRIVEENGVTDPERIVPLLLDTVRAMSPENLSGDDVTIMVLRPNGVSVALWDDLLAPVRYLADAVGWGG